MPPPVACGDIDWVSIELRHGPMDTLLVNRPKRMNVLIYQHAQEMRRNSSLVELLVSVDCCSTAAVLW